MTNYNMWRNTYKDYKPDDEMTKRWVEPGRGIVGCEMHELNGWGEKQHERKPPKMGWFRMLSNLLFKKKEIT